jgi:hypothetical protein
MVPLKKVNNPGTEMDGKFQRIFKLGKNAEFHAEFKSVEKFEKTFFQKM